MRQQGSARPIDNFVGAIQNFGQLPTPVQTDLLAYYLTAELGRASALAKDLGELRAQLHLSPHTSIAVYLSTATNATKKKPPKYVRAPKGYVLERNYRASLEAEYLGRPTAQTVASDLRRELQRVTDPDIGAYLAEAVSCFEYGLFRAAIVLTWCVAYSRFRDWLFTKHLAAFNTATSAWKTPVVIRALDDFQDLNEATVIDTARKAAVISKELHKTLKSLLDQRNSYAHPSHKPIRSSIAEAYIETTLQEVIPALT